MKKPLLARLTPAGVALLYTAFAAVWITASGYLLTLAISDPLLHSRIELIKGLVFVAVTGMLLYLLLKGWSERLYADRSANDAPTIPTDGTAPHMTSRLVLVFIALVLIVPLIGLAIVKMHIPQAEQDTYRNLEAIARLKSEQIENWLDERRGDGEMLAGDDAFAARVDQFVRQEQDAELSKLILGRFERLLTNYHYTKILLLDVGGRLLLSSGEDVTAAPVLPDLLREALASKQVQRRDIYRDEEGHIHLEWAVPLVVSDAQGERVAAVVVLRVTAQRFIFPLIQNWPTASASAETLLVRRDGESVLLLNELRHRKEMPMTMRLPAPDPELPAAVAIRANQPGTVHGRDYRGVDVLAAYRPVTGTRWHIVAKIDRDEILAPMWDMVYWIGLIAFIAVTAIMAALLLLWRQQQRAQHLALAAHSAAAVEESERRFRAVAQSANDAIISADSAGNIVNWNQGAERLFGYTEAEINGQPLIRLIPERYREFHRAGLARVAAGGEPHVIGKVVELAGLRKDGSEFPLELSLAKWEISAGLFFTAIIRDITERKQAGQKLAESERHFRSLFENMLEGYAYCRMVFEQGTPRDFVYMEVNRAFGTLTGLKDVLGKNVSAVIPGIRESNPELFEIYGRVALTGQPERFESYVEPLKTWFSISVYCPEQGYFVAVFDNITARKADEARIQRLTQLYAALSQCNQAIVRCTDEAELFPQICRDAVQFGGMKMAWVGLLDPVAQTIKQVASFGEGAGQLQGLEIPVDADSPFGRGSTGAAIRENRPYWCQDFQHDPLCASWNESGARPDWAASAALPLRRDGSVVGAFTLYAAEPNAFDEDARKLLVEMAIDISFALDNFAHEARREHAENEARLLTQRITLATEAATIGIWDWHLETDHWYATPTYFTMLGYAPEEGLLDRAVWIERVHPEDRDAVAEKIQAVLAGSDAPYRYEARLRHADGSYRWVNVIGRVAEHDENGKAIRMLGVRMDITERKRAEEALQLRALLLDSINDSVFVHDFDGNFTYLNETAYRSRGYMLDELMGMNLRMLDVPEYEKFIDARTGELMKHGRCTFESAHLLKNGSVMPIEVSARIVESGGRKLVISAVRDITERKRTEESLRKLSLAVEQSPSSIVITGLDANIEYANAAFVKTTGYSLAEAIGQNPRILHSGKTPKATYDDLWAHLTRGKVWKGEFINRRKDGSEYIESVLISPVRQTDGSVTHYLAIKEDITEFKRAQEAIYRLNEELEDKVAARTAELDKARLEAEQANRSKSDFLAAMSHEIRTPMNGVIGMIDILQQSSLTGPQMEMANIIHDSAFSLLVVINDILDFSKIEAGKLQIEIAPMDVADVVDGSCESLYQMALKKGVELTLFTDPAIPATVMGDAVRLRQILVNLASNAIKFSSGQDRPGKISVRAVLVENSSHLITLRPDPSAVLRTEGFAEGLCGSTGSPRAVEGNLEQVTLEFRVTDNGIGIDRATQARLFTPFTQADTSTTRAYGGTGLGLVISRRLANIMGGEIAVHSEPGKGSLFCMRVPFDLPQEQPVAGEVSSLVAGLPCLVVGGKESLADDLAAYLAHDGAVVERATDTAAMRQWIVSRPPGSCIVVIDTAGVNPPPDTSLLDELRIAARPEAGVRFVAIERGGRRRCRAVAADLVELDAEVMHRRAFLEAVAIAAGRIKQVAPEEKRGDASVTPRLSREEARRRGSLILIAEDNEINQKVILQQLMLLGRTADIANNGREALKRWQSGDYAILFADLHMPEMDGYELTVAIRATETDTGETGKPRTPIIAFTANALKGEADRCRAIGMDDYLSKPVQLADLKAMLEKWMPAVSSDPITDEAAPAEGVGRAASPFATSGDSGQALPAGEKTCRAEPDLQPAPPTAATSVAVDVNVLKALIGDDDEMIREFLHDFRLSAKKIAAELRAACGANQAEAAGSLAHKLKSSSRSVGALALGELCAAMEKAGKGGDAEALAALLPKFEQELMGIERFLDEY